MQIFLSLHKVFWKYWMCKVKVAIFKVNRNDEYCQKLTSWLPYVFDHKMRTKNDWDAVKPILELRKVGESYQKVDIAHSHQF